MRVLNKEKLARTIEATLRSDMESCKVGAAAMVVRQRGEIVYRGFFGDNVTEKTLFRLASMTKPITAVAIMRLVDKGLVKVDEPIETYLPGFAGSGITVKHLLTHSSGLGSRELGNEQHEKRPQGSADSLAAAIAYYETLPLAFEPGTTQDYSPIFGFDVLARIAEVVSGVPYDRFLQQEIFAPLGMEDTTFDPNEEQWSRMISMHNRVDEKNVTVPMPEKCIFENFSPSYCAGGAALAGTLEDYGKFAEMLLNKGGNLLSAETVKAMGTQQYDIWGLGMRAAFDDEVFAPLPKGCFGWSGAYGTHFWVDPANQITAVYMKNSYYDGGSGAITAHQFEIDVYASMETELNENV